MEYPRGCVRAKSGHGDRIVDLGDSAHLRPGAQFGQRMRAGMLLLHSPEVIFLDEPTLGLDVLAKQRMIAFCASSTSGRAPPSW